MINRPRRVGTTANAHSLRVLAVLGLLAVEPLRCLPAQSAPELLSRAARAYQNLELDAAAGYLRQALATDRQDTLLPADRVNALMYLFAADVLRERRDSAAAVARDLLSLEPRYQPEGLIFPPAIVRELNAMRRELGIVAVHAPESYDFRRGGAMPIVVVPTSSQQVSVLVIEEGGAPVRILYRGWVHDSLVLHWNGQDSAGAVAPSGRYLLLVSTHDAGGDTVFELHQPVFIDNPNTRDGVGGSAARDTRRSRAPPMRSLPQGVTLGVGAAQWSVSGRAGSSDVSRSGLGPDVVGTLGAGVFAAQVRYREAKLQGSGLPSEVAVEGVALAGVRALWMTLWAGPHARAFITDSTRERRMQWEVRLDASGPLVNGRLDGFLGAAMGQGWGVQGGLAARVSQAAALRLGYRVDQQRLDDGARLETTRILSLLLELDLQHLH